MANLVSVLWFAVLEYGKRIHTVKGSDGKKCWEMVKPVLLKVPGNGEWTAEFLKDLDLRKSLDNKLEDHHFLYQHFKIPAEDECTFVRLMQVAYNAGQMDGSGARERLPQTYIQEYDRRGMNRLETYCRGAPESFLLTPILAEECLKAIENPDLVT